MFISTIYADDDLIVDFGLICDFSNKTFTIYNKTEYDLEKDNFCKNGEKAEEDDCYEFQKISGKLKIYDGPFEGFEKIFEKDIDKFGKVSVQFKESGVFFTKIEPKNKNFNSFEELLEIRYCNSKKKLINKKILKNGIFEFEFFKSNFEDEDFNLKILENEIKDETNLSFKVKMKIKLEKTLRGEKKIYEKIDLKFPKRNFNLQNYEIYEIFQNSYKKINFKIEQENILVENLSFATYILTEKINETINDTKNIVEENISNFLENETNLTDEKNQTNLENQVETQDKNLILILFLLGEIFLICILSLLFFKSMNKNKINKKVLEYIKKYREPYTETQIRKVLEKSNISKHEIDKCFIFLEKEDKKT